MKETRDEMPCYASDLYEQQKSTRSLNYPNFMNYTY